MLHPPRRRPCAPLLAGFLAAALAGLSGAPPALAAPSRAPAPTAPLGSAPPPPGTAQAPSQMYLDAMAHANDAAAFLPGAAVTVPYRPPAGASWPVGDGSSPPTDGLAQPGSVGPASGALVASTGATGSLRREVFGFLPYWSLGSVQLDYSALSTIAYFAINATASGTLDTSSPGWPGWGSQALTSVIDAAHASGVRVVLVVERFAWTASQATAATTLLSSSVNRQALATHIAAAVGARGVDGVNLDFEPIPSGQGANFVDLVRRIRSALSGLPAHSGGYELTVDTMGWPGNYDIAGLTAAGAADAAVIMGYDYRNSASGVAGSVDPLGGSSYDLTDTINNYLSLTSASKIILALPYYGRAWSTAGSALHAATLPAACSTAVTYAQVVDGVLPGKTRQWDSVESSPWLTYPLADGCNSGTVTRELYYDDVQSLGLRYDLVNAAGLRGAGMWALGYEGTHTELNALLKAKFGGDRPLAGIVNLAPTAINEGVPVSWRGADALSPITTYDVQVSTDGGPFAAWLSGTAAMNGTFLGTTGHAYAFRVRAHSAGGSVGSWDVTDVYTPTPPLAVGGFAVVSPAGDGLNVRWSPDTSSSSNILTQARTGSVAGIIGGPVVADGYTWYEAIWPITSWGVVGDDPYVGVWMAAGPSGGDAWLSPVTPPNSTVVTAGISGLSFNGAGPASLGPTGAGWRVVTPNGNGERDTIEIDWTNRLAFAAMTLQIYRADGTLVGSLALGARSGGAQSYAWDGRIGGSVLPAATYLVQISGSAGGLTYDLPSADPVDSGQIARFGIALSLIDVDRYGGADRYETAAKLAAAFWAAGSHPPVYVAGGLAYPDALSGGPAAARRGGPILLVQGDAIPASTAAALVRLQPSRIVVLGGPSVVSSAVQTALGRYGPTVRLAGSDRYATAVMVSRDTFPSGAPVVYLVSGTDLADAMTGGAAAGRDGGPILLTTATSLPAVTQAELLRLRPARVVIIGSTGVFSASLEATVARLGPWTVTRLWGGDRFATAVQVAATYGPSPTVFVDQGLDIPDGLAAAALKGPLVLVPYGSTPAAIVDVLRVLAPQRLVGLGSAAVLPDAQLAGLAAGLGP